MNNNNSDDFDDFLESTPAEPISNKLQDVVNNTRSSIHQKLNPSWFQINKKVLLTHFFASLVTLSLCNQMGVRLFFDGPGLMDIFMNLGFWACMGLCGAFYMGTTFLILPFILSLDERNKFQKQLPVFISAVSIISLSILFLLGSSASLGVMAVWLIGAEIAGLAGFKFSQVLRRA